MSRARRGIAFAASMLDPGVWFHGFRILHYYGYAHVRERRKLRMGPGVRLAPNVSLANGQRISLGEGVRIGERCSLWAGDRQGRIFVGENALFGPEVYVTASNYVTDRPGPVFGQPTDERDVHIGARTWLGRGVVVLPGVSIGADTVVGAGSVVVHDLPAGVVAVGVPARVVKERFPPADDTRAGR